MSQQKRELDLGKMQIAQLNVLAETQCRLVNAHLMAYSFVANKDPKSYQARDLSNALKDLVETKKELMLRSKPKTGKSLSANDMALVEKTLATIEATTKSVKAELAPTPAATVAAEKSTQASQVSDETKLREQTKKTVAALTEAIKALKVYSELKQKRPGCAEEKALKEALRNVDFEFKKAEALNSEYFTDPKVSVSIKQGVVELEARMETFKTKLANVAPEIHDAAFKDSTSQQHVNIGPANSA